MKEIGGGEERRKKKGRRRKGEAGMDEKNEWEKKNIPPTEIEPVGPRVYCCTRRFELATNVYCQ